MSDTEYLIAYQQILNISKWEISKILKIVNDVKFRLFPVEVWVGFSEMRGRSMACYAL